MRIFCFLPWLFASLPLLASGASDSSTSQPLRFVDTFITLNSDNNIVYYHQTDPRKQELVIDLPYKQTLRFVTLDNTNIVRAERYSNTWVLLLETSRPDKSPAPPGRVCQTAYGAVIVRDDGEVFFNRKIKGEPAWRPGCAPKSYDYFTFTSFAKAYVNKKCEREIECSSPSMSGAAALSIPRQLRFGDTFISVNAEHNLMFYSQADPRKQEIVIDLPHKETLHFVTLDYSNIVKAERFWDTWIVLLQTSKRVKPSESPNLACETSHGAVIVRDDGKVFFNKTPGWGSGCPPISYDRLAFIYLANQYVNKK